MPENRISDQGRAFAKHLRAKQSSPERALWHELRANRLSGWKFRRQVPLDKYVVDFVCFERRLIVEVNGPIHKEAGQKRKDAVRDAVLVAQGFGILRFDTDVPVATMLKVIRSALAVPLSRPLPDGRSHPLPQGERAAAQPEWP